MLVFDLPWAWLLLPLPMFVWLWSPALQSRRDALRIPFLQRLARLTGNEPTEGSIVRRRRRLLWVMLVVSWVAAVAASTRPQWLAEPIIHEDPGRDLLVAVDLSGSMAEKDFVTEDGTVIDRLTATKRVLKNFIANRPDDRIGLILYGDIAVLQAPVTSDHDIVLHLLDEATVRMAGPKTMLGDALGLAIRQLENSDLDEQVVVLLTDGNDSGSLVPPDEAAELAAQAGVTVHCVAIGNPATIGEEAIDDELLKRIAAQTGGEFFTAMNREELEAIHAQLDLLEQRVVQQRSFRPRHDLFAWPLGLMLGLTMFMQFLAVRRYPRGESK